jgi:hypothetical protein
MTIAKFVIFLYTVLFLLTPAPLFADLSDFQEDVEDTREQSEEERRENSRDEDYREEDREPEDGGGSILGQIILEILQFIWVTNNTTTTYGDYPYSPTGYINWAQRDPVYGGMMTTGYRDQWFAIDAQGVYLEGLGFGAWSTFRGHFYRFFGPYIDAWSITDGEEDFYGFRLGGSVALFQSDPFSLSALIQYDRWGGVLDEEGLLLGIELRSYPFRPVGLQYRASAQLFGGFTVVESDVQLGIILSRYELFGGYRWWGLTTSGGELTNQYRGPVAGIRIHF